MDHAVGILTRYPLPGRVKTRLAPALGTERTAELHRQMIAHTVAQVQGFPADVTLWLADAPEGADTSFAAGVPIRPQPGGDLGERMLAVIRASLAAGAERVALVGTDCPGVGGKVLAEAFDSLHRCDLVVGPAWDGGYYLIGMTRPIPELFAGIEWGSGTVLDRTLAIARDLRLSVGILGPLPDVDEPADLIHWTNAVHRPIGPIEEELVSVIIPTFNEESSLHFSLDSTLDRPGCEVLIVDGGSTDRTEEIAAARGVPFYQTTGGRSAQLNLGAAIARGSNLLFLHADSKVPRDFVTEIRTYLADPGVAGGAFRLHIDDPRSPFRWVEWGVQFRSRRLGLPYGDQGLFTRAELFWELGGFASWPILEDVDFVRRLHGRGRVVIAESAMQTSARRWRRLGVVRTTATNQMILAGYFAGMSPERLASWYRLPSLHVKNPGIEG